MFTHSEVLIGLRLAYLTFLEVMTPSYGLSPDARLLSTMREVLLTTNQTREVLKEPMTQYSLMLRNQMKYTGNQVQLCHHPFPVTF